MAISGSQTTPWTKDKEWKVRRYRECSWGTSRGPGDAEAGIPELRPERSLGPRPETLRVRTPKVQSPQDFWKPGDVRRSVNRSRGRGRRLRTQGKVRR